jgi:hypothetical protein
MFTSDIDRALRVRVAARMRIDLSATGVPHAREYRAPAISTLPAALGPVFVRVAS